jgi:hypothetical protein
MVNKSELETVIADRLVKSGIDSEVDVHIDTVIIMDGGFAEIASEVKDIDDV